MAQESGLFLMLQQHPTFARYLVGDDGLIIGPRGKPLKPFADKNGYLRINVWEGGTWKQLSVHILVCETFHGPRPTPKHHAAHTDGDKVNNHASNLRWATPAENERDKALHGKTLAGSRHHQAKLDESAVRDIRVSAAAGRCLARQYGVSEGTISSIRHKRTWVHI